LFIVAICQILAIVLILKGRSDSKKAVRNYGIAMPLFLTIQFLPKHGEWMVLILGALVILLQIILTVLLLKSEVIHKSRLKRGAYRDPGETSPTVADEEETAYAAYEAETSKEPAQDENEEAFYYASVNTENEFPEDDAEGGYSEAATYSLDETTGELYEDPAGEYTEEFFYAETPVEESFEEIPDGEQFEENSEALPEDGAYIVSEDEENAEPVFLFDDEDVVYGDPAEPPYEDDAVQGDPEENPSNRDQ
jgi:hypothetical protein